MDRVVFIYWEKVSLVVPESEDVDVMYRGINNINISKYVWSIAFHTLESEMDYLDREMKPDAHFLVIMHNKSEEIIWGIRFDKMDQFARIAEVWIAIYDEDMLWKWYGTEAMKLMLKYGFEYLWLHKVKLQLLANNPRAQKSYEKAWFSVVGRLKQDTYRMWEYVDVIIMEILRSEYKIDR